MRDIVLTPTYYRPEYLALMLEYLAAADGAAEKEVWIGQDRHTNDMGYLVQQLPLVHQVVEAFRFSCKFKAVRYIERQPTPYIGNPYNFLELYKEAYNTPDARYVYLVEDDVLAGKDFFTWHEAVQPLGDYFCTVGWHCVRNDKAQVNSGDPTGYIESTRDFSSIGVCWRREKLAPFVKHARPEYYRDHRNYLAGAFPGNLIPAGQWTEQAGIVTRLLHETKDRWVAWPTERRCAHVGVSGYHRPNGFKFQGNLGQRVEALRAAVASTTIVGMNKDFGGDIEPVPVYRPWTPDQLQVVQRFPYEPGVI